MLDLRHLNFNEKFSASSAGVVPKAYHDGKFYKASNFNVYTGFYGFSAVNDVIATRYLNLLGIPCLEYDGAVALVRYESDEHATYINWSPDYRDERHEMSFESLCILHNVTPSERVEFFKSLDTTYFSNMVAADFLVGNRDRHGSNIRLLGDTFAPLFDFNLSLFMPDGQSRIQNIMANNYVGSPSLQDNLSLTQSLPATKELGSSEWAEVFRGTDYPYVSELQKWLNERRNRYEEIRCGNS